MLADENHPLRWPAHLQEDGEHAFCGQWVSEKKENSGTEEDAGRKMGKLSHCSASCSKQEYNVAQREHVESRGFAL